jgi:hypothetical protein
MVPVFGVIRLRPVGVSVSVSGLACGGVSWTWTTTENMSAGSRGGRASGRGGMASEEFGRRRVRVGVGDVEEALASLGEGGGDGLWEGDGIVSSNGWPIDEGGERVEIGEILSLGRAAAARPAVVSLGGLGVRGEGMPLGELRNRSMSGDGQIDRDMG